MSYGLTIKNRTPDELRQLASERRELAHPKQRRTKALLLSEARLLEHYADLRSWVERTRPDDSGDDLLGERSTIQSAPPSEPHDLAPFLTTLSLRMALPVADQHALLTAAQLPRRLAKGESVIAEGEHLSAFLLLCSGAAHAVRTLENGGEQVSAFYVSGDALNPGDLALGRSRTSIRTLTPAIVIAVSIRELGTLMERRPAIARGLWRETAFQAAIQREWLAGLGRKSAEARLAHFLCEVACRLQIGGQDGETFELPLTQRELADILGLSCVHVNRVLQQLRHRKLIDLDRGLLTIRNREALYRTAEFDPAYLKILEPPHSREEADGSR